MERSWYLKLAPSFYYLYHFLPFTLSRTVTFQVTDTATYVRTFELAIFLLSVKYFIFMLTYNEEVGVKRRDWLRRKGKPIYSTRLKLNITINSITGIEILSIFTMLMNFHDTTKQVFRSFQYYYINYII